MLLQTGYFVGVRLFVCVRVPHKHRDVIFVGATAVCAVQYQVAVVVQQVFAVVADVEQHAWPSGGVQHADGAVQKEVGVEYSVVVRVDEQRTHFVAQGLVGKRFFNQGPQFFGCAGFGADVHFECVLQPADFRFVVEVGRELCEVGRIAIVVFVVAPQ